MCFYHDDDGWTAEVWGESRAASDGTARCGECRRPVPAGAGYLEVYARQYEECQACEWGECSCPGRPADGKDDYHGCECVSPRYGETMTYRRCDDCSAVLDAIRLVEESEGCEGEETTPGLYGLKDAMRGREYEGDRYAAKALQMRPDLAAHVALLRGQEEVDAA